MAGQFGKPSLAQSSVNAAATLTAALITAGLVKTKEEAAQEFASTRDTVYAGLVEIYEAEPKQEYQPRRSYGGGGGNSNQDPGSVKFNSGKMGGKTIAQVAASEPSYLQWYANNAKNDWMKARVQSFLEQQAQSANNAADNSAEVTGEAA